MKKNLHTHTMTVLMLLLDSYTLTATEYSFATFVTATISGSSSVEA